jgi:hypothetical protein
MTPNRLARPAAGEYAPYYETYVSSVPGSDVLVALESQVIETCALLRRFRGAAEEYRYAPGKWSVRELAGHVIDAERIFAYRALRISRNDPTPLASFDENSYIAEGPYANCPLASLSGEFDLVRRSTIALLRNLPDEAWTRRGTASEKEITVRGLAWIIAGHEAHHTRILRERYLH